ncbi:MAG: hypothetical protein KGH55_03545 [Nanoarchaeota archaeon]|nr:hypothetical protein [Nanoarchaeota archaeon]
MEYKIKKISSEENLYRVSLDRYQVYWTLRGSFDRVLSQTLRLNNAFAKSKGISSKPIRFNLENGVEEFSLDDRLRAEKVEEAQNLL